MKKKFKRAVAGFIAGLMTLSTVVSLVTPAFADDDIIVKDGFTFEKLPNKIQLSIIRSPDIAETAET